MAGTPKYSIRVTAVDAATGNETPAPTTWRAEIVRRVTAKRSHVTKTEDGFSSEADARAWAEQALKGVLENHARRTAKDLTRRVEKNAKGSPR